MTKRIADPRMRALAVRAVVDGFSIRRGRGHFVLQRGASTISLSTTDGDHRAYLNARATARRAGVDVDGLA